MRIRSIKPEFWRSADVAALDYAVIYDGPVPTKAREWLALAKPDYNLGFVYMFFGGDELLYVGKAANVLYRVEKHRREKPWWASVDGVVLVRITAYDYREADRRALRFEKAAIAALLPTKNLVGPRNLPARLEMV